MFISVVITGKASDLNVLFVKIEITINYTISTKKAKIAYRIDLCDNCRQYIKTIDTRKLTHDPNLYLEDMTTLHLDILATTQGYKRPAPTPWGI